MTAKVELNMNPLNVEYSQQWAICLLYQSGVSPNPITIRRFVAEILSDATACRWRREAPHWHHPPEGAALGAPDCAARWGLR
jgi:hypothetical protein